MLLSESGLASVILHRGAKELRTGGTTSDVLAAALRFRLLRLLPLVLMVSVVTAYTLTAIGLGAGESLLLLVLLLAVSFPNAIRTIVHVEYRLSGRYFELQGVQLVGAACRLATVAALWGVDSLSVYLAVCILFGEAVLESALLWRPEYILPRRSVGYQSYVPDFMRSRRATFPMNLAIVLQTQVLTVGLAVMGGAVVLAEVSALSRVALVFAVVGSIVINIGSGHVARIGGSVHAVIRGYAVFLGAYFLVAALIVALSWMFSEYFLVILGSGYEGLGTPFLVVAVGTAAIGLGDSLRVLNQARGWVAYSWVYVPLTVAWAVTGLLVLNIETTIGAAWWMAAQAAPSLLSQSVVAYGGIRRSVGIECPSD